MRPVVSLQGAVMLAHSKMAGDLRGRRKTSSLFRHYFDDVGEPSPRRRGNCVLAIANCVWKMRLASADQDCFRSAETNMRGRVCPPQDFRIHAAKAGSQAQTKQTWRPAGAGRRVDREVAWLFP